LKDFGIEVTSRIETGAVEASERKGGVVDLRTVIVPNLNDSLLVEGCVGNPASNDVC
jgi:hypothetical protein